MKHACSRPIAGAIGAVTAAATAALLLTFGPQRISLATAHTGDTQLASALERSAAAEPGHRALSALVYDQGRITFGGLGADEHTEFEIGSVTKTFNAELVRQLIRANELTLHTTVGDILGPTGAPIDSVTVEELLNHTAGLPAMGHLGLPDILKANVTQGATRTAPTPPTTSLPPPGPWSSTAAANTHTPTTGTRCSGNCSR